MPVEKTKLSEVCSASVLTSGYLKIRAKEIGENTYLSRIIRLLEDAASSKAPIARIADKVSSVFVPCVIAISIITFATWIFLTQNLEQSLRSAISVLVISCPCALGLATPTALTVGIGRGAKMGILFRNGESLEKLSAVKTIVFDKTGTLTEGKPNVTDVFSYGMEKEKMITYAAAIESGSAHPLAKAIRNIAETWRLGELPPVESFSSVTGVGTMGKIGNKVCKVGKMPPYVKESIYQSEIERDYENIKKDGKTAITVVFDDVVIGIIGIADCIREEASVAVKELQKEGLQCFMLTGDNKKTAAYIARQAGLDGFYAELLPDDKEKMIRNMTNDFSCAMVGDGINDAPALLRADVGIAIGAGTDVAIDCAGIILSKSNIMDVVNAYRLSKASLTVIKQNLFWALIYNCICIPIAAGVFFPIWGWQLTPMLASAAMSFSSVFVVFNALRLRNINLEKGDKKDMFFKKEIVTHTIGVDGMMCMHCVNHVKTALEAVKGVKGVQVSLEDKKAVVDAISGLSVSLLEEAVIKAGYKVYQL